MRFVVEEVKDDHGFLVHEIIGEASWMRTHSGGGHEREIEAEESWSRNHPHPGAVYMLPGIPQDIMVRMNNVLPVA